MSRHRIQPDRNIMTRMIIDQVLQLMNEMNIQHLFAGQGEDVYAQTVDMEAGVHTVSSHINAFVQLKTTYAENKIFLKDFIIAEEPERQNFPKQHDIWKQLRDSNILNYLDLSESEKLISYAKEHGVIPLSKATK